ncbi:hypothetical protein I6F07_09535 [Ensifer sp. IC4062]|nr:hypothetical protein [Ensifer sp. IC4062]MCA1440450.1 hypothetical protein [Ensifer sp. IC4062]
MSDFPPIARRRTVTKSRYADVNAAALIPSHLFAEDVSGTAVLRPGGLIATRDADVGGNVIYPQTSGIQLFLDLWQR